MLSTSTQNRYKRAQNWQNVSGNNPTFVILTKFCTVLTLEANDLGARSKERGRDRKMLIFHIPGRLSPRTGFTLIEVVTSLMILGVLAVMLVPLATTLLDSQRANNIPSGFMFPAVGRD